MKEDKPSRSKQRVQIVSLAIIGLGAVLLGVDSFELLSEQIELLTWVFLVVGICVFSLSWNWIFNGQIDRRLDHTNPYDIQRFADIAERQLNAEHIDYKHLSRQKLYDMLHREYQSILDEYQVLYGSQQEIIRFITIQQFLEQVAKRSFCCQWQQANKSKPRLVTSPGAFFMEECLLRDA